MTPPARRVLTRSAAVALLAALVPLLVPALLEAGLPGTPSRQWRWRGVVEDPLRPQPDTTPVVVQLTDDDGDGEIDENDSPDVVFLHVGTTGTSLTAVDGLTGATHFTVDAPPFGVDSRSGKAPQLAAGDVDGDGVVELLVPSATELLVFENDGTLARTLAWPEPIDDVRAGHALGVADLDQDGLPEVHVLGTVLSLDGPLAWSRDVDLGAVPTSFASFSQAADLDPTSPGLELLVGNELRAADGTLLWKAAPPVGATAIGDVDGDGDPEIALTTAPANLWLLDHLGATLGTVVPLTSPPTNPPPLPLMADLDGDGRSEIVVATAAGGELRAYEWDGAGLALVWAFDGIQGCCAGLTAFDFDGDGILEIVHRDELSVRVHDGLTGTMLWRDDFLSGTTTEMPIVADIDRDGSAEIVVAGFGGTFGVPADSVIAYDVPGAEPARAIWNQPTYHACNVEDDGGIPRVEAPAWQSHRSWHAQVAPGDGCALADCSASIVSPAEPGPGPAVAPCDGVELRGSASLADGSEAAVRWTSSCPGTTFMPADDVLDVTVVLGESCGLTCELTLSVEGEPCSDSITLRVEDLEAPELDGVPDDATVDCAAVPEPASPTASDDCDPDPALDFDETRIDGPCAGTFTLERTWTATDDCGNAFSETRVVSVVDDTPPELDGVPDDATVDCAAVPEPASPTASDDCDPDPALDFDETRIDGPCPGTFTLERTWTATDDCGNAFSETRVVSVVDDTPPAVAEGDDDLHCLWPPRHRLVRFGREDFEPVLTDDCSEPVTWRLAGCTSDQPEDGLGDGTTAPDCVVADGGETLLVRAERSGLEPEGRRYAVLVVAEDACGNASEPTRIGFVHVPHDRRDVAERCRRR